MLDAIIAQFAEAIAWAEGFYVPGSRPARNHNPGNLTVDLTGGGQGVGMDGPFIVYATDQDGFADLQLQIRKMFEGTSRIYDASMSILDVARRWTTTDQNAWARIVASKLGVTVNDSLASLAAISGPAGLSGVAILIILAVFLIWGRHGA